MKSLSSLSKALCEEAKIKFRKMWGAITKETAHLTTEKIEDLLKQELLSSYRQLIEVEIERKKGMMIIDLCEDKDTDLYEREVGYNQAIQEDITYLENELKKII